MATTFPGRLREAMNAKGIKAAALAARTGLSRAAISQYLSGQHTPSESRLALLAEMLDAGERYAKIEGMENSKALTQDDLYDVFDISSMAYIQDHIATAVKNGNSREVEAMPDPKEKKAATGSKKKKPASSGTSGLD